MVYNMTNVTQADTFYEIFYELNAVAGGYIALFLLVTLAILIFMVFKKYEEDTKKVLLMDSTIITVIAVLLWTIQLISWNVLIYPVIALFASIIILKFS